MEIPTMARMNKLNVRQQKFVPGLFEGKSATQRYIDAGYKPNQGNSSRLKWYDTIQAELTKLQEEARKPARSLSRQYCGNWNVPMISISYRQA
jgi:hypothetical protein